MRKVSELNTTDSYTVQFELRALSYYGYTVYINGHHNINTTANNIGDNLPLQNWASSQNYSHLIITEMDR